MRRYVVRFLVAILTFAIGVVLSLAFGVFRVQKNKFEYREWSRPSCRKAIRIARPAFLPVDSQMGDPLRLVYLGTSSDLSGGEVGRMRFFVENRSDRTVSGYWITGNRNWEANGKFGARDLDWSALEVLQPGESSTITLPRSAEGFSLRVSRVTFQDGSTWTNPRVSQ